MVLNTYTIKYPAQVILFISLRNGMDGHCPKIQNKQISSRNLVGKIL